MSLINVVVVDDVFVFFICRHPYYNISVGAITVDSKAMAVEFTAIVDSGTSYTYLNDPAYTLFTTNVSLSLSLSPLLYHSLVSRHGYIIV